ncbi:ATP-dependent helicase HrpB [Microbacterium excoecariae]|uniref:ATP-dependent helicase HrpB n=1 Tax=Microbacterium excoecariae TaxID=2715210 RepID=UPI00140D72CB|nr:ATP-dependent helicase HrpB [Microbacterium excoecariae]
MTREPRPFDLQRIGRGLPVAEADGALRAALAGGSAVVVAPPGSGKTTYVPPLAAAVTGGRVLVTQPRRVAVRAAARRLAELDGAALGERVGYAVRGDRVTAADALVEFVTPGLLLRRLLADPGLDGVAAVVVDEVHERSLDGDLLLAMLADVRQLRDDLTVAAMSATIDAGQVAAQIGGDSPAPIVDAPAALYPLDISYAPGAGPRSDDRGVTGAFVDHLAAVAADAHAHDGDGDALVFAPAVRDVEAVAAALRRHAPRAEVLTLHGRLPRAEQDRATAGRAPGDPPRFVVSTSLAESSLTVPGVRLVIDSGLARVLRRDTVRDMAGLVTRSASRASADQRAGRAARQGPGRAIRAYSEADFGAFRRADDPEIAHADLVSAMLMLAAWGAPGGAGMRFLTPPPEGASRSARRALADLGLVGPDGRLTADGARAARLPADPRAARALLAAAEWGVVPREAGEIVAALEGDHRDAGGDLARILAELRGGGRGAREWAREADRLARYAAAPAAERTERADGVVVALARPEGIARRVGERAYLLARGTRASLPPRSGLAGAEWIAVHDAQRAAGGAARETGAVVRLGAALTEEDALAVGAPLVETRRDVSVVDGRIRVRAVRALGAIELGATPAAATPEDARAATLDLVASAGIAALAWDDGARALRARMALLRRALGAPWPDVSDAALAADLGGWLLAAPAPRLPTAGDVRDGLRALLPWPDAARLDELAPERLEVPSGRAVRIAYPNPEDPTAPPVVAVKLQELFGLADTPRLVGGRVPVLFHLLSPGGHPLAVTADLASFWNGPYGDVRRQMRGRYPKHPWPEDPWTAEATRRTNRALRAGE